MNKHILLTIGLVCMTTLANTTQADTIDIVNRVENKLDKVTAKVNALQKKVTDLKKRVPDNPGVRDLAKQIAVDKIKTVLELVELGVSPQDILTAMQVQRAGFEGWQADGGPAQMQDDMTAVVDGVVALVDTTQRLRCYQNPNANIVPMSANRMRDTISVLPDLVLYGMKQVLDETLADWKTSINEMNDAIPDEMVQDICGYKELAEDTVDAFNVARCEVLTTIPWHHVHGLKKARIRAGRFNTMVEALAEIEPANVMAGAALNVEAGGGGTADISNPNKLLLNKWAGRTKAFSELVGAVLENRNDCLKEDREIEADLLACSLKAKYIETPLAAQAYFSRTLLDPNGMDMNFRELCTGYQEKVCEIHQAGNPGSECIFKGWAGPEV